MIDRHQNRPRSEQVESTLSEINAHIAAALQEPRQLFQQLLNNMPSLENLDYETRQRIACGIQKIANNLRCAFRCGKCGEPARIKCSLAGGNKRGVFAFMHSNNKTHGGTIALPNLELVEPAEDKRKRKNLTQSADVGIPGTGN